MPCNIKLTAFGAEDDRIGPECQADLQKQIDYLGNMNMLVYFNTATFQQDEFGNQRIDRQSTIRNIQVDQFRANFIFGWIQTKQLQDEITYIQYGDQEELEYYEIEYSSPRPSAWSQFPSADNPNAGYKFSSINFQFDTDMQIIERSTQVQL